MAWVDLFKTKAMQKIDTQMAVAFSRAQAQQKVNREHVEALEKAAMDGEQIWFAPNEENKCIIKIPFTGSTPS